MFSHLYIRKPFLGAATQQWILQRLCHSTVQFMLKYEYILSFVMLCFDAPKNICYVMKSKRDKKYILNSRGYGNTP
jgi:hypothetical protein